VKESYWGRRIYLRRRIVKGIGAVGARL